MDWHKSKLLYTEAKFQFQYNRCFLSKAYSKATVSAAVTESVEASRPRICRILMITSEERKIPKWSAYGMPWNSDPDETEY